MVVTVVAAVAVVVDVAVVDVAVEEESRRQVRR